MLLNCSLLCSLLLVISCPSYAALPEPLDPELESISIKGFDALYSMDYASAKQLFQTMIRKNSRHPAGYVYFASAIWLERLAELRRLHTRIYNRGNTFFQTQKDPVDPGVEKNFYATMEKGIVRAELRLKKNPKDLAGLYYLGVAHGALAGYESTVKRTFLSSMKHGTAAVDAHKKVVKEYPQFKDAYLSIGLYSYVVGKLPLSAKILMLLGGVHGSTKEGIKQLEIANTQGKIARNEAAALLVLLYDREGRYADAFKMLDTLVKRYPHNPVFQFESAILHSKMGSMKESKKIYEKLLNDPLAQRYLLDSVHFEYAELYFVSGTWERAYTHYLNSRRVFRETPVGLITLSHLRAGQCLDAMGRSKEAAVEYGYVLKQPEIQNSKTLARQYLKEPYSLRPIRSSVN